MLLMSPPGVTSNVGNRKAIPSAAMIGQLTMLDEISAPILRVTDVVGTAT